MTGTPRKRSVARAAVATATAVALALGGAASAGAAEPRDLCIPLLMQCGPTAPPPVVDVPGVIGDVGGLLTGDETSGIPAIPVVDPVADPNAPVMTLPAAQLGGSSISFSGLKAVSLVTVPLADGSRTTVIKLEADEIIIDDFVLDVRRSTGPSLVSTSTQMRLTGNCQVYVDSLSATTLAGLGISLPAPTPTPGYELPPQLLRVTLGLVGVTADRISFDDSHQHLYD